jgi:ABC-type transport system involved in cytochrome bd biosynthesis fused ATPase/permease subunit
MFLIPRFSLDLPQEPPTIIDSNRVPAYWPSSSDNDTLLIVENLVIRYAPDLPAVLQNVSFSLKARERVGLLGRTGLWTLRCTLETAIHTFSGSGKSTLAMSILRFVCYSGLLPHLPLISVCRSTQLAAVSWLTASTYLPLEFMTCVRVW